MNDHGIRRITIEFQTIKHAEAFEADLRDRMPDMLVTVNSTSKIVTVPIPATEELVIMTVIDALACSSGVDDEEVD